MNEIKQVLENVNKFLFKLSIVEDFLLLKFTGIKRKNLVKFDYIFFISGGKKSNINKFKKTTDNMGGNTARYTIDED